jgi:hypothetical protein
VAGLAAGCGGSPVEVTAPTPTGSGVDECAALMGALPDTVANEDRRDVSPDDAAAGAWGDPAIVLRCGVPKPPGLRPDSECFVVNDVGWLADEQSGQVVFTTIGRSTYVEVAVPDDYAPEGGILPPIADSVAAATRELAPCV